MASVSGLGTDAARWRAIVSQPVTAWSSTDARALLDLLGDEASRDRVGAATWLPGARRPEKLLARVVDGRDGGADLERFATAWRGSDAPQHEIDAMRDRLQRVLDTGTSRLRTDDWETVGEVVDWDRATNGIGLVDRLHRAPALDDHLRALSRGETEPTTDTRRFLETWRRQLDGTFDTPASVRDAAAGVLATPWRTWDRGDWLRLKVLLDADHYAHATGLSRGVPDVGEGAALVAARVEAPGSLDRPAQRLLGSWRIQAGRGFAVPESDALVGGRLGAHLIRRSDVDGFLAGSAWPHTTFHGNTNRETYEHVVARGAQVERNKRSAWGQGYYTALNPGGWGIDVVETAIRMRNPLRTSPGAFAGQLSGMPAARGATEAERVRSRLLAAGHDGIVIERSKSDGGDWVVGLRNEDMRVVVEDAPGTPDIRPRSPRSV